MLMGRHIIWGLFADKGKNLREKYGEEFLMKENISYHRTGLLCALGANVIWGLLPLYWYFLHDVSAYTVLAHRVIWSSLFMLLLMMGLRWTSFIQDCRELWQNKRKVLLLLLAAFLISVNWLVYIWAVTHDHVMDTSIGYYLNPLLSVLLGVVFFKEYLITAKRISIALAAIGVLLLTILHGSFPWISLSLAMSFAVYGAVKKQLQINPFSSITLETLCIAPLAILYLWGVDSSSFAYFIGGMSPIALFLVGTGLVTALPLILFSFGANALPLNVLGFLQYMSPTIAFLLAVFVFRESFGLPQLVALSCIWGALVIFSVSERLQKIVRIHIS